MKSLAQCIQDSHGSSDEYYTPDYAMDFIDPVLSQFKSKAVIWEPCCGSGNMVRYLQNKGHKVIGTDISQGKEFDALTYYPKEAIDMIITNVPYSIKVPLLKRFFDLDVPFAILITTRILDNSNIKKLLKQHKDTVRYLFLTKVVTYFTPNGDNSGKCYFMSFWLLHRIPLTPSPLVSVTPLVSAPPNNIVVAPAEDEGSYTYTFNGSGRSTTSNYVLSPLSLDLLIPYMTSFKTLFIDEGEHQGVSSFFIEKGFESTQNRDEADLIIHVPQFDNRRIGTVLKYLHDYHTIDHKPIAILTSTTL